MTILEDALIICSKVRLKWCTITLQGEAIWIFWSLLPKKIIEMFSISKESIFEIFRYYYKYLFFV